jgi:hypothetical protein
MMMPQQLLPKPNMMHYLQPLFRVHVLLQQQPHPQPLPLLLLVPQPLPQNTKSRIIRMMIPQQLLLELQKLLHIEVTSLNNGFNTWYAVFC